MKLRIEKSPVPSLTAGPGLFVQAEELCLRCGEDMTVLRVGRDGYSSTFTARTPCCYLFEWAVYTPARPRVATP